MEMVFNIMVMGIYMRVYIKIIFLRVKENIFGLMEVHIKEVLNVALEMDLEYGKNLMIKILKIIEDIMRMTKDVDMEFIIGGLAIFIRAHFLMIKNKDMVNYLIMMNFYIKECGRRIKKLNN